MHAIKKSDALFIAAQNIKVWGSRYSTKVLMEAYSLTKSQLDMATHQGMPVFSPGQYISSCGFACDDYAPMAGNFNYEGEISGSKFIN